MQAEPGLKAHFSRPPGSAGPLYSMQGGISISPRKLPHQQCGLCNCFSETEAEFHTFSRETVCHAYCPGREEFWEAKCQRAGLCRQASGQDGEQVQHQRKAASRSWWLRANPLQTGFENWLCPLPAVRPWTKSLYPLCLICEIYFKQSLGGLHELICVRHLE